MKYKVLINGENSALIKDFFIHNEKYFQCLCTTKLFNDVLAHFDVFKPDAYLYFFELIDENNVNYIRKLREDKKYNGAPIIVVGKFNVCDEIEERFSDIADLIVRRPISPDNLNLQIVRYLEQKESEKEEKRKISEELEKIENDMREKNRKKSILIVDDDKNILKMLRSALCDKYDVTTMINGVMVEKYLESRNADLIILDYEMPIETGADVFRKIKNNDKTKDIPVCFLTGVSEKNKIMEIMEMKPHGYLLKPVNMELLLSAVSNLVS